MPDFLNDIKEGVTNAKDSAKKALGFDVTDAGSANKAWPLDKKLRQVDPTSSESKEGMYFTSSRLAHVMYGQHETGIGGNTPYVGFQYFVKINFNGELKDFVNEYTKGGGLTPSTDYAPIIQSIDLPGMSVSTDKLNEYNRWRISQTKIEFGPVKLSIFDSVNGLGLGLWRMYYAYYFMDGNRTGNEIESLLTPESFTTMSSRFGYNIDTVKDLRYLITSIDIFQVHRNRYNRIRLHHPRISDFNHGVMAYDSAEAMKLDFTFDYERVTYMEPGMVKDTEELRQHFEQSYVPDLKSPFNIDPYPEQETPIVTDDTETPEEQSLLDEIMDVKNPADALAALQRAKAESQELLASGARAGALFNQVQMDITGQDTPIIEAPSVRPFSAVVNNIPTGYSDVRRASRKIKGG